ncbi:pyruvate formate lyase family protein [Shigella flexneri]
MLSKPRQKHVCVCAELAETVAARCTNAQRREELLTIAEIFHHNAEHKPQTFWQAYQVVLVHEHHSAIQNPTPVRYRWGALTSICCRSIRHL